MIKRLFYRIEEKIFLDVRAFAQMAEEYNAEGQDICEIFGVKVFSGAQNFIEV